MRYTSTKLCRRFGWLVVFECSLNLSFFRLRSTSFTILTLSAIKSEYLLFTIPVNPYLIGIRHSIFVIRLNRLIYSQIFQAPFISDLRLIIWKFQVRVLFITALTYLRINSKLHFGFEISETSFWKSQFLLIECSSLVFPSV